MNKRSILAWGILQHSENHLDGKREYLDGDASHPCRTRLFYTREEARRFNNERYGYIRNRPDLQREPHGWKLPKVVCVVINMEIKNK